MVVARSDRAKPDCKKGKPCGDICIPKNAKCRSGESKEATSKPTVSPWAVAAVAAASAIGVPVATYAAVRSRYREGFKESAKMAQQMADSIEPDPVKERQHSIIFGVGGLSYGGEDNPTISGKAISDSVRIGLSRDKGRDFKVIPVSNAKSNTGKLKAPDNPIDAAVDALRVNYQNIVVNNRNQSAVELAAQVLAYSRKYPDKQLVMTGHSMGGMIVREAQEILRQANPDLAPRLKSVAIGSVYGGLTEPFGNAIDIAGSDDPLTATFPTRNPKVFKLNSQRPDSDPLKGHYLSDYLKNPQVSKFLSDFIYQGVKIPTENAQSGKGKQKQKNKQKSKNDSLRLDRTKPKCRTGKPCGNICIPKDAKCRLGESKEVSSNNNSLSIAVASGVALLGVSTTGYLAARQAYRSGIPKSAQMATELSKTIDVPDIGDDKQHVTFTVGGFYGQYGDAAARKGEDYFEHKMKTEVLDDTHFVTKHRNIEFNLPEDDLLPTLNWEDPIDLPTQIDAGLRVVTEHYKKTLEPVFRHGRNPEAVKLAAEVHAIKQKYPDKEINLCGHSAGGMITHEAAEILQQMGIKAKVVNLGTGWYGFTEKVGESYTIADKQDMYLKTMAIPRDPVAVGDGSKPPSFEAHTLKHYMRSDEVKAKLKTLLNTKPRQDSENAEPKCKTGKPCGKVCIPKSTKCRLNSYSPEKRAIHEAANEKRRNKAVLTRLLPALGIGATFSATVMGYQALVHKRNQIIDKKNEQTEAEEKAVRNEFQDDVDNFVDFRAELRDKARSWGVGRGYTDIELVDDWYWGFPPTGFMQEPIQSENQELEQVKTALRDMEKKWRGRAGVEHFNNIPDTAHSKNRKKRQSEQKSDAYWDAFNAIRIDFKRKKAKCKNGKPCGDICIPKEADCHENASNNPPRKGLSDYQKRMVLTAGGITTIGAAAIYGAALIKGKDIVLGWVDEHNEGVKADETRLKEMGDNLKKDLEAANEQIKKAQGDYYFQTQTGRSPQQYIDEVLGSTGGVKDKYTVALNNLRGIIEKEHSTTTNKKLDRVHYQNLEAQYRSVYSDLHRSPEHKETAGLVKQKMIHTLETMVNSSIQEYMKLSTKKELKESDIEKAYQDVVLSYKWAESSPAKPVWTKETKSAVNEITTRYKEWNRQRELVATKKILEKNWKGDSSPTVSSNPLYQKLIHQLKIILGRVYTDGIDHFLKVNVDKSNTITGLFRDGTKILDFKIKGNEISYKLAGAKGKKDSVYYESLALELTLRSDATKKKPKCTRGISCGAACVASNKACRLKANAIASFGELAQLRTTAAQVGGTTPPPAPERETYETNPDTNQPYTIRELKKKASEKGVYRYSEMTSDQLKEALKASDTDPDQRERLGRTLTRERSLTGRAQRAGLIGKTKPEKQFVQWTREWNKISKFADYVGKAPIGWGMAATGAFLAGAAIRTYEQAKDHYRQGLNDSARSAEARAVGMDTDRVSKENIAFVVGGFGGLGHSSQKMRELLEEDSQLSDKNHYVQFDLKETDVPPYVGDKRNPDGSYSLGYLGYVASRGVGQFCKDLTRQRNDDAVELAAQIYAHAVRRNATNYTMAHKDKNINIVAHGMGGEVVNQAMDILSKMKAVGGKSSPTGKDVLERINIVNLSTPDTGFSENLPGNYRNITSGQDPFSWMPKRREKWVSTVKGNEPEDYIRDPEVREQIRQAFGYYDISAKQRERSEKTRSRKKKESGTTTKSKPKPKSKPQNTEQKSDAYWEAFNVKRIQKLTAI